MGDDIQTDLLPLLLLMQEQIQEFHLASQLFKQQAELLRTSLATSRARLRRHRQRMLMHATILNISTHPLIKEPEKIWKRDRPSNFWEDIVPSMCDDNFKETFRMTRSSFDKLVSHLSSLAKSDTNFRKAVSLNKRIAIALYVLATTEKYETVANLFGVGRATISQNVTEFCRELWLVLRQKLLPSYPFEERQLTENIAGFEKLGFPQCCGAIGSHHIEVESRKETADDYRNSNGWDSTILMAIADHRNRFTYVSVGAPGKHRTSEVYGNSALKRVLEKDKNCQNKIKTISSCSVPAVILGDLKFPQSDQLLVPYNANEILSKSEHVFNLSSERGHQVVEDAFKKLKARFKRLGRKMRINISHVPDVVKACCLLHNFLIEENDTVLTDWLDAQEIIDEDLKQPDDPADCKSSKTDGGDRIRRAIAEHFKSMLRK